jgi:hypothetical protein
MIGLIALNSANAETAIQIAGSKVALRMSAPFGRECRQAGIANSLAAPRPGRGEVIGAAVGWHRLVCLVERHVTSELIGQINPANPCQTLSSPGGKIGPPCFM